MENALDKKEIEFLLKDALGNNNKAIMKVLAFSSSSSSLKPPNVLETAENAVCILGMHRSGTSLIAGLLQLFDIFVGDKKDLLTADDDNPKGYYERFDVVKLNSLLLSNIGSSWKSGLPCQLFSPELLQDFSQKAEDVIKKLKKPNKSFLLKDPRLCLTFSAWKTLLRDTDVIIIYRNPFEVAQSLYKRNNMKIEYGLALWEYYIITSFKQSLKERRLLVSFSQLLQDPISICKRLYSILKSSRPDIISPSEESIVAFVDPQLNRSKKMEASTTISSWQKKIYESLEDESILGWTEDQLNISEDTEKILKRGRI